MKCFKGKHFIKLYRADGSPFRFQDYVNYVVHTNFKNPSEPLNTTEKESMVKRHLHKIIDNLYLGYVRSK